MITHCTNSQFKNVNVFLMIHTFSFIFKQDRMGKYKKYKILNSGCIIVFLKFYIFSGYPGFALMRYTQVDESN